MEQNNIEISPAPNYWDGEGPLFLTDTEGYVHIQPVSGFDIDQWYEEEKIRRSAK